MSGLFGKPKAPTMPPVQPPPAVPEVGPETEEFAMRAARRRRGFARTILTGALEPAPSGRKSLLG